MGMTIVKGFKKEFTKTSLLSELTSDINEYYPNIIFDIDILTENVLTRLQVLLNLPLEMVVKNIGREIDTAITHYFKMNISDIGMIIGDRVVKRFMELELIYFKKSEN